VIIRNNQYAGTLYGEIQTGSVHLASDSSGETVSKQVQANLLSTGGLGVFESNYRDISGVYDMTTNLRSDATTGNADFTF
jgi:hypothetical protein